MRSHGHRAERGQALALFTLALSAIVMGVALVVDGGYAFAQRRSAQNAADFAAMAGTRIIGVHLTEGYTSVGTAANVEGSIRSALTANDAVLVSAEYVDDAGVALGSVVGATSIPSGAFGVVVEARTEWSPFLLGAVGVTDWLATARATAKTPGEETGKGVVPVGIEESTYRGLTDCPVDTFDDCVSEAIGSLTTGHLNGPGQFGWLSFGLNDGKCDWEESLGMLQYSPPDTTVGGCQVNQPFLDFQLGPPARSFNCCEPVDLAAGPDLIGALTGNTWGDLSEYIAKRMVVWTPIWDEIQGTGANAAYHIVGFGAIVFTGVTDDTNHAKWLEGVAVHDLCYDDDVIVDDDGTEAPFCQGPGDSFEIGVTGEVQLIR